MTINVRLASITSSAGDKVEFSQSGVTCLVGGNNAGKSQTLTDIAQRMQNAQARTVVIKELAISKPSEVQREQAEEFLKSVAVEQPRYGQTWEQTSYLPLSGSGQAMSIDAFQLGLAHGSDNLGTVWPFFFQHFTAGSVGHYATGNLGHLGMGGSPSSPLHRLFLDGDLEQEFSDLSHEIFGEHLTVDRANMDVRLRVGRVKNVEVPLLSHPTIEYAQAVAALPPLADQGDGIKSFLGLAMMVLVGRSQILLFDEPEAFLHPGQARALGRWLSRQARKRDMQIVVSTHDRDFVLGLLEGNEESVRFVRIVRTGSVNRLHELAPEEVNATWSDPVLRYSNILQGLFHRRVAICEADADCRFYGAVLDELANETGKRSEVDDLLLVPAGGKHGVPALARALAKLGVETHAFVDFDVLRERRDIKAIVDAIGGTWTEEIETGYRTFTNAVKNENKWDAVKKYGVQAVPFGPPQAACKRLIELLSALRTHVVPIGEMEGFDGTIGVKGSDWVTAALKKDLHRTSVQAKDYVGNILTA